MLRSLGHPLAVFTTTQRRIGLTATQLAVWSRVCHWLSGLESCCAQICGLALVLLTVALIRSRTLSICRVSRHQLCRISSCAHFRSILDHLSFQICHTPCQLFLLPISGMPAMALSHRHNSRCVLHTRLPFMSGFDAQPSGCRSRHSRTIRWCVVCGYFGAARCALTLCGNHPISVPQRNHLYIHKKHSTKKLF